jgi:hypothetical protein
MVCFNSDAAASSESRSQASAVDGRKGAKVNVHVIKWIHGSVGVARKERERKLFIFIGALRVEWSGGWNDCVPVWDTGWSFGMEICWNLLGFWIFVF